jgi:hypothetical protein
LALALVSRWIGGGVIRSLILSGGLFDATSLPTSLPAGWDDVWDFWMYQSRLLRRLCETWAQQDWLDWRIPLFAYLSAVFAVRLAPVRHDWRAALVVAGGLVALLAGGCELFDPAREFLEGTLWSVLTYVWATMLLLLAVSLLMAGLAGLARLLLRRNRPEES